MLSLKGIFLHATSTFTLSPSPILPSHPHFHTPTRTYHPAFLVPAYTPITFLASDRYSFSGNSGGSRRITCASSGNSGAWIGSRTSTQRFTIAWNAIVVWLDRVSPILRARHVCGERRLGENAYSLIAGFAAPLPGIPVAAAYRGSYFIFAPAAHAQGCGNESWEKSEEEGRELHV